MVNFRYHLVTITAIFLALAAGIVLGVSVGNQTAPGIDSRLKSTAEAAVRRADTADSDLRGWHSFSDKAAPGLLAGRLAEVPVLLVGVRGVDGQVVKTVRESLTNADASFLGTVWLTGKLKLERQDDIAALASALNLSTLDSPELRSKALSRLAQQLAAPDRPRSTTTTVPSTTPTGAASTTSLTTAPVPTTTTTAARAATTTLLAGLAAAGFIDLEDPSGSTLDPQALLPPGTRFVILSGDGADLPDDVGAIPFVQGLVAESAPTVAVEAGRPAADREPEIRSVLIGPLRAAGKDVDAAVSTVNNLEDFRGQAAMVLALADLGQGRVGHYGVGSGADRLVPEAG
jgi:hypothetical protein